MAYTATLSKQTVFGDERVWQGVVAADAASGVVSMGFGTVTHVDWSPKSCTTGGFRVRINATAAGVAAAGTIGVSGATSGDEFYLTVFGR